MANAAETLAVVTPDPAPDAAHGGVEVITFGCRLNAYESEVMRVRAAEAGLGPTILINTCAVTGEAVRQARQAIRKARRARPDAALIVTGCAAQIDPQAFAAMPEVDQVLGNALKVSAQAFAPEHRHTRVRVEDIMSVRESAAAPIDGPIGAMTDRVRAHVEIQNGCDHRCTFCIIPFGRGNSRSIPAGAVVAQVRRLVEAGVREVVLTGVDLTSWGADLPATPTLGQLTARILRLVPELERLRLSSIDAAEIDADLMRCLAEEARLAPYLHLSLQSGDDLILKRMKRRHSRDDAIRLTDAVRRVRPDVAFGADLIAGFPTESDAAFKNSLRLVDDCGLAFLHVFPFSPRPGTPAARMPQLPGDVIRDRAARLRERGALGLAHHLDRQIGRTVAALVERPGRARAADFTEIDFAGDAEPGAMAPVAILSHDGQRALGSLA